MNNSLESSSTLSSLPLVPPPGSVVEFKLRSEYFDGQISLRDFRTKHPYYSVLATDPLVLEPEQGRYVVLTKFAAAIFWNCSGALIEEIIKEIGAMPSAGRRNTQVEDEMSVFVGKENDEVTFQDVCLRRLTLNHVKIISLALGQSAALERFENDVQAVMSKTAPVVTALRDRGVLLLSERKVLRTIGFGLEVRAAVLANLTLFDAPPETWESENLAHLDSQLYDHFDLAERHSAVNQKVEYLSDLNTNLLDLLHNRKNQRLEWIIIILIVFEIVIFIAVDIAPKLFTAH